MLGAKHGTQRVWQQNHKFHVSSACEYTQLAPRAPDAYEYMQAWWWGRPVVGHVSLSWAIYSTSSSRECSSVHCTR